MQRDNLNARTIVIVIKELSFFKKEEIMRKSVVIFLTMLLICNYTEAAEDPKQLLTNLPKQIGNYIKGKEIKTYDEKELGASARYVFPNGKELPPLAIVSIYIYDEGLHDIQDGISEPVKKKIARYLHEFPLMPLLPGRNVPMYKNMKVLFNGEKEIQLESGLVLNVLWLSISADLAHVDGSPDAPVITDTYIVGLKGNFVKFRISRHRDTPAEIVRTIDTTISQILDKLIAA